MVLLESFESPESPQCVGGAVNVAAGPALLQEVHYYVDERSIRKDAHAIGHVLLVVRLCEPCYQECVSDEDVGGAAEQWLAVGREPHWPGLFRAAGLLGGLGKQPSDCLLDAGGLVHCHYLEYHTKLQCRVYLEEAAVVSLCEHRWERCRGQ